MTEAEFLSQVIDLARLCGFRVAHFRPGRTAVGGWRTAVQGNAKGFPDLVLVRPGQLLVAELKTERGKLSPEQREWLAAFEAAGVPAYCWTPASWAAIEQVFR